MANKNKKTSAVNALLEVANEVVAKVDDIKSVATNLNPEATDYRKDNESSQNLKEVDDSHSIKMSASDSQENLKTDFDWFLNRRTIKDSESVRIPREIYKQLKTISNITNSTMNSLIGNILEDFLQTYNKDIENRKKRFIKEIG